MNWYLSEIHPEPTNNTRGRGKTLDSTRKSRESLLSGAHEGRGRLFFFFFNNDVPNQSFFKMA